MASSSSEKSRGGLLSCVCWLLGAGLKVSTLVVLLALLTTVHQLRSSAEENAIKVERAEKELADATSQQDDATRAYKEIAAQSNQLQTDLANSRKAVQEMQVQLSKKVDLQKDLDRKTQEAKSAKQEALVLSQKLQELEAEARRVEQEQKKSQDASSVAQALESEKQQLQQKVSLLEASLQQEKSSTEAASEQQKSLTQKLQETAAKLAQAEKLKEMLSAKEKAQERKIEELREQVKKLEDAKKAEQASAQQVAARMNQALHDLEAARAETAQTKKDLEAKALELQRTLADREQMIKTATKANGEREELITSKKSLENKLAEARKEFEQLQKATAQDAQRDKEILVNERDALLKEKNELQQQLQGLRAAAKAHEAERKNFESVKEEKESAGRLMIAEINSRDERIGKLSAEVDVFRKKWTECDSAAKEKLSKLQAALEKCEASRGSVEQRQPKTDVCDCSSVAAQEEADLLKQCEKERAMHKKEKKDFDITMRDMFKQLDGKDSRIQKLEGEAANTQKKSTDVEKTLTDKVASLQTELRACLVIDAESCAKNEGEERCRDRADCSKLKLQVMELEAALKNNEEERQKLEKTVVKIRQDWTKANEYADEMMQKANEAEKLARGREQMVEQMREQLMRSAEITHGDLITELRALVQEHDKLMKKYDDDVKPLQEKLEKARKGWLQNDKELVELKKELKREKLRTSLFNGDDGQK